MIVKKLQLYVCLVLLIGCLASCSSTKSVKKADFIENLSEAEYMEKVLANTAGWEAVTAKMQASLKLNGKSTGKFGGTLRIKRGEVIQLSIAPFLGIEVGRAEISPDGMLVIDRVNKRYVHVSFEELKNLTNVALDFHILESLFLNEIFLPTKERLTARDLSSVTLNVAQPDVLLDVKKSKTFSYKFRTEAPEGQLMETRIGLAGTAYALQWKYDDFQPLEQHQFPSSMNVSFEGGSKPSNATFSLSRLSTNADWETRTEVSKKYQKVELEEIIKMLVK